MRSSSEGIVKPSTNLVKAGMDANLISRLDSIIAEAIKDKVTPGASIAVGYRGALIALKGYGRLDWDETSAEVSSDTLYDLASLTKVIGSTTAAMMLEEEGKIDLDRTVASYLPEFNNAEKSHITLYQLLIHRGGMEPFAHLFSDFRGREQYLEQINNRPLKHQPGTVTEYSDWDLILLQLVIEKVTGISLDKFLFDRVWTPLSMTDTCFNPIASLKSRIAPTEIQPVRGNIKVWGEVHDENAWAMGGVSGHAGLFSTARNLCTFAQFMLDGGFYNTTRLLKPSTIARWTARQGPSSSRALGWDTPSPNSSAGRYFSPRSFGHTGFTGTSIWIDPQRDLYVILLTNRVNPTRDNPQLPLLRRAVADIVQESIRDSALIDWESRY